LIVPITLLEVLPPLKFLDFISAPLFSRASAHSYYPLELYGKVISDRILTREQVLVLSSPPRRTARSIRLFYVKRWPSLAKPIQTPHFVAAGVLNANVYRKRSGDAYPSKAAQRPGNPLAEGLPRGANYFSPLATLITDGVFIILRAFGRRPERALD
jgi:hypothetical protein